MRSACWLGEPNDAGGSRFTAEVAAKLGKSCLVVDLDSYAAADRVAEFLDEMAEGVNLAFAAALFGLAPWRPA
jgi:hypothetical protein